MDQATIDRYQAGGDIYASLLASYGKAGADKVAAAALTGDETNINSALVAVKFGQPLNTSTLDILGNQLATDPLAAPLADANTLVGNSVLSFLKNPWVLFALGIAAFVYFGGMELIASKVARKVKNA